MPKNEINQILKDLEQQREAIKRQISASQEVLLSVDEKIADFKRRQEERLTSDDRVDDEVVKKVTETAAANGVMEDS